MSHMKDMAIDAMNKEDIMSMPEKKPRLVNGKTTITADLSMIRRKKKQEAKFRLGPDFWYDLLTGLDGILHIFTSSIIGTLAGISSGFEKGLETTLKLYRNHLKRGGKNAKKSIHRRARPATRKN